MYIITAVFPTTSNHCFFVLHIASLVSEEIYKIYHHNFVIPTFSITGSTINMMKCKESVFFQLQIFYISFLQLPNHESLSCLVFFLTFLALSHLTVSASNEANSISRCWKDGGAPAKGSVYFGSTVTKVSLIIIFSLQTKKSNHLMKTNKTAIKRIKLLKHK